MSWCNGRHRVVVLMRQQVLQSYISIHREMDVPGALDSSRKLPINATTQEVIL